MATLRKQLLQLSSFSSIHRPPGLSESPVSGSCGYMMRRRHSDVLDLRLIRQFTDSHQVSPQMKANCEADGTCSLDIESLTAPIHELLPITEYSEMCQTGSELHNITFQNVDVVVSDVFEIQSLLVKVCWFV